MGKHEKKKPHSRRATYDWCNVASDIKLKNKIILQGWLYDCEDIFIFLIYQII